MGDRLGRFWYWLKQIVLHLLAAVGLWVVVAYAVLGLGVLLPVEWCQKALLWVWLAIVLGYLAYVLVKYVQYRKDRKRRRSTPAEG